MPVTLDADSRRIVDDKNFATIATIGFDGAPQTSVVWINRDGDNVQFTSLAHRQKIANIQRDPRVSVTVFEQTNPYSSVEIRGHAELIVDEPKALSMELSHKYLDEDPPKESPEQTRYIVRVVPEKVIRFVA